jgi:demethylmenaquinone methyltransferase/2-methoxy-6-polyprenyl-1,4-benzoquinol methylase
MHVHHVVPWIGGLLSRGSAYQYLAASISAFPPPEAVLEAMRGAGLRDVSARAMSFGAVHLFVARKP